MPWEALTGLPLLGGIKLEKSEKEEKKSWSAGEVALGKLVLGLGIAAIVLWLSPMALTDLLMTFGIPLLIIAMLLFSVGLTGSGFLELLNSKNIGERVQAYVKEKQAEQEALQ